MTQPAPDADPLQTARDLQGALEATAKELSKLRATVRLGKKIVIGLAVSLVLDLILTPVIGVTALSAQDTSARLNATVTQLHATQVAACQAGNVTRAAEVQLWEHILALAPPKTPQQRKVGASFIAYVKRVFAPRNCQAIYKLR